MGEGPQRLCAKGHSIMDEALKRLRHQLIHELRKAHRII